MIFESQHTLKQCEDKITVCWGVGRIFTQEQRLKFTRSHFSVNAKKGCEQKNIAVQIDARIFSLLIFTSRFVEQSHARLFVEIYIRACDKLTFFSKYARAYWRTGSYASAEVTTEQGSFRKKVVYYGLPAFLSRTRH